jgi:peptidoglycan LD-endopeptidase LytH
MICPVPGSTFIDSFGAPRPQGWAHKGVDMMASTGTPILAPVGGTVTHRGNAVGGLAFHLNGDDGRYYYGAHLSAYGASGNVSAGTVIGYVGNTGDAIHTPPHLHLEIHVGGSVINPYPAVRAVC